MAHITNPRELFTHKLGAALTMEQTIVEMLQTLEQQAQDKSVKKLFAQHRRETEKHVRNVEQAFSALGEESRPQPCPAIEGLKTEGQQMIQRTAPEIIDAVLLEGAAETEHHEIAVYEALIESARAMRQREVVDALKENLEQEKETLKQAKESIRELAREQTAAAA
jgi:ferritin-like metal-binding protein YciE